MSCLWPAFAVQIETLLAISHWGSSWLVCVSLDLIILLKCMPFCLQESASVTITRQDRTVKDVSMVSMVLPQQGPRTTVMHVPVLMVHVVLSCSMGMLPVLTAPLLRQVAIVHGFCWIYARPLLWFLFDIFCLLHYFLNCCLHFYFHSSLLPFYWHSSLHSPVSLSSLNSNRKGFNIRYH